MTTALRFNIYIGREQVKKIETLLKEAKRNRKTTLTFKNFKQLCIELGINETPNANSKQTLLKELKEHFDIRQQKGKLSYRIFSVYDKPYPRLLVEVFKLKKDDYHKSGIYKISHNDGRVYIGSTVDFRKRFSSHATEGIPGQEKTYSMIKEGGIFEVIQFVDLNEYTIKDLRRIEELYIIDYCNDKTVKCINERNTPKFKRIKEKQFKIKSNRPKIIPKEQQIEKCKELLETVSNTDFNLTKKQYNYIVKILGGQANE